jgi:SM-20-related protein
VIEVKEGVGKEALFEAIANDLSQQGYSICSDAIPTDLIQLLTTQAINLNERYTKAGIGRQSRHLVDDAVRSDKICWIDSDTEAGCLWLNWTNELKQYLNRRLFLGLNYFESHFAYYEPGDFYKKHKDAFVGQGNRILSVVTYLNDNWRQQDGGQLLIYDDLGQELESVLPEFGTLVIFLSEEFPHEVLPAQRERYSIAGWYRAGND